MARVLNRLELRMSAMNLLARREHSRKELFGKLRQKAESPVLLDDVLDQLVAENLISDERFTESFIRSCVNRGQGPLKIGQALQQRGIAADCVTLAMESADVDWCELARSVKGKRFGAARASDQKEKAKMFRFMQSRGFSCDIISDII